MLGLDDGVNRLYTKLMTRYADVLTGSLRRMLEFALQEADVNNRKMQLEIIKETFGLSDKQLNEYMVVLKMEQMYKNMLQNLNDILELVADDKDLIEEFHTEFDEIKKIQYEIQGNIKDFLLEENDNENNEEDNNSLYDDWNFYSELSSDCNFVMYLSNVEDNRDAMMEAKSGSGRFAMSSVLKKISMLSKSNYELLRQKGKIHQINESGKRYCGRTLTSANAAYERVGGGTTKVGYIRIPVLQSNLDLLRKKFENNNLRYVILVISFGDFKTEGISESKLYDRFNVVADMFMEEMEKIIKMFKEPFTPENFSIAISMIEKGVNITKLLSDNTVKSLGILKKHK